MLRTQCFVVLVFTAVIVALPLQHPVLASPAPVAATAPATTESAPAVVYDQPTPVPTPPAWALALLVTPTPAPLPHPTVEPSPVVHVTAAVTASTVPYDAWSVISAAFPDRAYTMARIAFCESRYVRDVVGEGRYIGWFQIDPAWVYNPLIVAALGPHVPADLTDPVFNTAVAAVMAANRPDLGDWANTRNGCPAWNAAPPS